MSSCQIYRKCFFTLEPVGFSGVGLSKAPQGVPSHQISYLTTFYALDLSPPTHNIPPPNPNFRCFPMEQSHQQERPQAASENRDRVIADTEEAVRKKFERLHNHWGNSSFPSSLEANDEGYYTTDDGVFIFRIEMFDELVRQMLAGFGHTDYVVWGSQRLPIETNNAIKAKEAEMAFVNQQTSRDRTGDRAEYCAFVLIRVDPALYMKSDAATANDGFEHDEQEIAAHTAAVVHTAQKQLEREREEFQKKIEEHAQEKARLEKLVVKQALLLVDLEQEFAMLRASSRI
ncbi:hypothetical protein BDP81DRAFT_444039 [Colletotrichum phormii]|uniref:Uncharacterized protein n=1 Tax=Colletotrichum phormii TaxID=359342 RepID=A0AAJ0A2H9_9PEZI|nr:uncharacterized protein BDP81DRAFT_444039 [Colletotrichum phormii]KAK1655265.1 hypothetical protein BDP81DRAFT_444039 [Colletotrichum phormii]